MLLQVQQQSLVGGSKQFSSYFFLVEYIPTQSFHQGCLRSGLIYILKVRGLFCVRLFYFGRLCKVGLCLVATLHSHSHRPTLLDTFITQPFIYITCVSFSLHFQSQTTFSSHPRVVRVTGPNRLEQTTFYISAQKHICSPPGSPSLPDIPDDQLKQLIQTSTTSGKPMCGICLSEFSSRSSTFTHVKAKHGGKATHQCLYCPLLFITADRRAMHISRKHREAHRMNKLLKNVVGAF